MPAPNPVRIPVSTYRLQFHKGCTFHDAQLLVPYLSKLGITECYCSPLLAAKPGSPHGYDICDHSRLNPELGTDKDFDAFTSVLAANRMGLLLDFVPNHMAMDPANNLWWRSVLEHGSSSPFARFFDIDWEPENDAIKGKVLLPILGEPYRVALENGRFRIHFSNGGFSLQYFNWNLPLNPETVRKLLRTNLEKLEAGMGTENRNLREFQSILLQLDRLPVFSTTEPAGIVDQFREQEAAQEQLAKLVESCPHIRRHIEDNIRMFHGEPSQPESYNLLHDLLEAQPYRFSCWRTALHEVNYRRFFDINELVSLRMEDPDVFTATHALLLTLLRRGVLAGLRLDHVDGLFDPAEYFQRLGAGGLGVSPIYIVAEKLLSSGEPLPESWEVHGTTGYDFLNDLNGLFVDSRNAQELGRLYEHFVGRQELFCNVVYESKKLIIMTSMESELNVLARELNRISKRDCGFQDCTLASLQEALREVVSCFSVYRTYVSIQGWTEADQSLIDTAIARALHRNGSLGPSVFKLLRQMLLPTRADGIPEEEHQRRLRFAMKFQQFTGAVQAKGLEDTAFYRYVPLLSLNEVGGDPARFGRSPDELHQANRARLSSWPLTMLTTSTHDTKRGEDGRARLNVLSEVPGEWHTCLLRWARANDELRTTVNGAAAPDRSDEYLFYQALLGSWPAQCAEQPDAEFVDRLRQYMQKASKEKKVQTSWINPSVEYEDAVADFVRCTLTGSISKRFLKLFVPFQQRIARLGMLNSLSQVVLKIASPGVPDFYQGAELWDLNLVDPDNRRPVDFACRLQFLDQMEPLLNEPCPSDRSTQAVGEMLEHWQDGRIKLFLTTAGLRLRRAFPQLFLEGAYVPLYAEGERKDHLVAFGRMLGTQTVIALAPRLVAGLAGAHKAIPVGREIWQETRIVLPPELASYRYRNVFTQERIMPVKLSSQPQIPIAEALRISPVGIFLSE